MRFNHSKDILHFSTSAARVWLLPEKHIRKSGSVSKHTNSALLYFQKPPDPVKRYLQESNYHSIFIVAPNAARISVCSTTSRSSDGLECLDMATCQSVEAVDAHNLDVVE